MEYEISIRFCVKVKAKDEEEAIDKGYTALGEEFFLTEHQLGLSACEVKKEKGPKSPS